MASLAQGPYQRRSDAMIVFDEDDRCHSNSGGRWSRGVGPTPAMHWGL